MPYNRLSTTKIARQAGCHPNTVRFYEQQGFIPPVRRNPKNNYRIYNPGHVDHMQLAVTAFKSPFPGWRLRRSLTQLVKHAATRDLGGALEIAYHHLTLVQSEITSADRAADFLENWAKGLTIDSAVKPLQTTQTAKLLGVTVDALRTWERNGLLEVPRNINNRYRQYGPAEIGRLRVIRMLRNAGYSINAIHRMFIKLDQGQHDDLKKTLDTPEADEDIFYATDSWLSTLTEQENRANWLINMLQKMILSSKNDPDYYQDQI